MLVLMMAHRIWKETKQQPGRAGPGDMLGCCLVYFHLLWIILSTSTVHVYLGGVGSIKFSEWDFRSQLSADEIARPNDRQRERAADCRADYSQMRHSLHTTMSY